MQMTPSFLSPQDVKTNTALYIQFECSPKVTEETECITYENMESTCNRVLPFKPKLVDVLMKRKESFPVEKSVASPTQDITQYNALIRYLKENKFGGAATSLGEYGKFVNLFSKFLWSVDAHYAKAECSRFKFLGEHTGCPKL